MWNRYCEACGSGNTQSGVHEIHCLDCGRLTRADGTVVPLLEQVHSDDHYKDFLLGKVSE